MALYKGRQVEAVHWFPPGHPKHPGEHPAVEMLYKVDRTFLAAYLKKDVRRQIASRLELKAGCWLVTNRRNETTILSQAEFEELYEPV